MLRHPMEIKDTGVEIFWDKYIRISGTSVKVEQLSKEEVEAMTSSVSLKSLAQKGHFKSKNTTTALFPLPTLIGAISTIFLTTSVLTTGVRLGLRLLNITALETYFRIKIQP